MNAVSPIRLLPVFAVLVTNSSYAFKFESDSVVLNDTFSTAQFVTVNFRQTYDSTPLVFALPTNAGSDPSALRIRNVTTTGFEITQVEPLGVVLPPHGSMTIHYIAVEPGIHTLLDGTLIEAGSIPTTTLQHGSGVPGAAGWDTVNFSAGFSGRPAVIAHIQDMANESNNPPATTSVPWLTTAIRNVSTTDMQIALERAEVNDGGTVSANETIGYMAIEGGAIGNFIDNSSTTIDYEAIVSADNIRGWSNGCFTVNFTGTYSSTPLVVATKNKRDGGDGGWLRRCALSAAAIGLTVDEDTFRDSERNHTSENAGLIVFSQAFDADIILEALAEWHMDETSWSSAGSIIDSTGNGKHASPIGGVLPASPASAPVIAGDPGTCGYADIPDNTNDTIDAISTGFTPGNQGSISFWFNNKSNWNTNGDRLLFDASNDLGNENADKHFFLVRRNNNNGSLRFVVEDSAENRLEATAKDQTFAAGEWVHIAVTWDLPNDIVEIYVNGASEDTDSDGSNGTMGNINDLYIGDQRDTGTDRNSWSNDSANGYIDEFRIYNTVISVAQVNADMNASHACVINLADHFDINHAGTSVNCEAAPVTIEAHLVDHTVDTSYAGLLNLSTSTGRGDWSVISGLGVLNNGVANDGLATYDLQAVDNGVVILGLKDTVAETVNINVSDGATTELTGAAIASEDLDLVFSQTGFRFIDAVDIATIDTQIAGKDSNLAPGAQTLYLQAIRTSDDGLSCTGVFADGVTANIDLGSICSNPGSCLVGQRASITNNVTTTAIANPQNQDAGLNYSSVALTFTTNSRAPIVLNYADAGKIQLNARYDIPLGDGSASGNLMVGNSNAFVVRPFAFDMDFSGDRAVNGVAGTSYAAGANGSKFQIAGANFPLSLSAVGWNSADDLDNNGEPDACADLTDNAITANFGNETTAIVPLDVGIGNTSFLPAGGDPGTLTTSANGVSFASGIGSKTISWNEVGILNMNSTLTSYLGTGQDVLGNVCNVGRFYPNNFVIANPVVTERSDIVACADPFSYMGENFTISYDLQAMSLNPPGNITQNYVGAFAKLDVTALADMNYGATDSGTELTARLNVTSAGVFAGGVAPVTATLQLARDVTPDGVHSNFDVGIVPTDSDSVSLLATDINLSLDGGVNTHGLLGQTEIRYGRLTLQNNFGSELLALTMPVRAEYYLDATAEFITNADDSCTIISTDNILLFNNVEAKAGQVLGDRDIIISAAATTILMPTPPLSTVPLGTPFDISFVSGLASFDLTAPGVLGYVDVEIHAPAYLLYDFDSNGTDDFPLGRGNFGIFKGSENIIYIRETIR